MDHPRRQEPDHFQNDSEDRDEHDCEDEDPPSQRPHYHHESPPESHFGWHGHSGNPDIELYDLIDFSMPVGNTGIVFVAGLTGWRESDGTARFILGAVPAAYRRAASTLAWMSLINGQTFQFLRLSLNLTTAQAAVLCGESEGTVISWENGAPPIPVSPWQCLADAALTADQRAGITVTPLPAPDYRPRKIRVYPDIPGPPQPPPVPPRPCDPCDDDHHDHNHRERGR